jgi:hypothetical protein
MCVNYVHSKRMKHFATFMNFGSHKPEPISIRVVRRGRMEDETHPLPQLSGWVGRGVRSGVVEWGVRLRCS